MKKNFLLYIMLISSCFILKSNDVIKNKIIIYYGIRGTPGKNYYNFQDMTEYKVVIENQEIKLYNYIEGIDDYLMSNKKIKETEIEKIKEITNKTIKKAD